MLSLLMALAMLWSPGPVSPCYVPPVNAAVVDPFRAPTCSFCAGNRGLEYRPEPGTTVTAAAPGVVGFSGLVAGVRYLVIDQADGRTATYGRLQSTHVASGARVQRGDVVATTTDRLFFGLRVDGHYIDPAPFLGVARYRPRLVPIDGLPARRPPPPTLKCAVPPP